MPRTAARSRAQKFGVAFLPTIIAIGASLMAAAPAAAETSHLPQQSKFMHDYAGTGVFGTQTFYVYMNAGESLTVDAGSFTGTESDSFYQNLAKATATVTDPLGVFLVRKDNLSLFDRPGLDVGPVTLTAATTSTYVVTIGPSSTRYDNGMRPWRIEVSDSTSTRIPGRVFVTDYNVIQPTNNYTQSLSFWAVSEFGFQYRIDLERFNGWNSVFRANAFGNVDRATCLPTYAFDLRKPADLAADAAACGGQYLLFFEPPAADLPTAAPVSPSSALGRGADEHWVLPTLALPAITNLTFTPTTAGSLAGNVTFDISNHHGTYDIEIDADGDGRYDGALDRTIPSSTYGPEGFSFDGLDADGNAVTPETSVGIRVRISQSPELHMVIFDVESMGGGVAFTRLNGTGIENDRIYWNDSELPYGQTCGPVPTHLDTSADGVPAADAALRGWFSDNAECNNRDSAVNGTWGNERALDTWTYGNANVTAEVRHGGAASFTLTKTSANGSTFITGDEVQWQFTVTNTGTSVLSNVMIDDPLLALTDWLCVASLNIGATATCDAPVGYVTTTADATAGTVRNVATASATAGLGASVPEDQTASATVTVTAPSTPAPTTPAPSTPVAPTEPSTPTESTPTDGLAATGTQQPTAAVFAAALCLLTGLGVLVARRRATQR